jgi:shikimate dehydrogenase
VTRLGVLGWPVAHSRSPAMQNAALRAVGLAEWRYQLLPVPPALFDETVAALDGAGFRGANVTIPHKERALTLADAPSERARGIGAANTLVFRAGGGIEADNTDAPALIEALGPAELGSALVLGAGGTARSVVWALLDAGASEIRVWNRTQARARRLCEELGATPVDQLRPADLLINCTSMRTDVDLKHFPLTADAVSGYGRVVDYVYGNTETGLIKAARARSIPVVDGLELLVRQGALSFAQFTGRQAPAEVMRAAVNAP